MSASMPRSHGFRTQGGSTGRERFCGPVEGRRGTPSPFVRNMAVLLNPANTAELRGTVIQTSRKFRLSQPGIQAEFRFSPSVIKGKVTMRWRPLQDGDVFIKTAPQVSCTDDGTGYRIEGLVPPV
jgi:hypothetical protein